MVAGSGIDWVPRGCRHLLIGSNTLESAGRRQSRDWRQTQRIAFASRDALLGPSLQSIRLGCWLALRHDRSVPFDPLDDQ